MTNFPSACAIGKSISAMPAKKTLCTAGPQLDPAGFELSGIVPGERGRRTLGIDRQQNARLHQDLKTVADAQNQFARLFELGKKLGQPMLNLAAEDAAGADVVAITESAWQTENLKIGQ